MLGLIDTEFDPGGWRVSRSNEGRVQTVTVGGALGRFTLKKADQLEWAGSEAWVSFTENGETVCVVSAEVLEGASGAVRNRRRFQLSRVACDQVVRLKLCLSDGRKRKVKFVFSKGCNQCSV